MYWFFYILLHISLHTFCDKHIYMFSVYILKSLPLRLLAMLTTWESLHQYFCYSNTWIQNNAVSLYMVLKAKISCVYASYLDYTNTLSSHSSCTNPKTSMFLISYCCCLCPIHWSQVLCCKWRCSWCSPDRRCSNYIWVINNFISY